MDVESNITNTYRTRDIAELLKISTSSIRKYAIALEAAGAVFNVDIKGERLYDERDFKAFSSMRQQISEGSTMKAASLQAAAMLQQERQARREAGEVLIKSDREVILAMAERLEEQERMIKQVLEEREELRNQLSRVIAGQQRIETLMEEQKQSQTPEEQEANDARTGGNDENNSPEAEEKPEPKRRGLFARIFGGK